MATPMDEVTSGDDDDDDPKTSSGKRRQVRQFPGDRKKSKKEAKEDDETSVQDKSGEEGKVLDIGSDNTTREPGEMADSVASLEEEIFKEMNHTKQDLEAPQNAPPGYSCKENNQKGESLENEGKEDDKVPSNNNPSEMLEEEIIQGDYKKSVKDDKVSKMENNCDINAPFESTVLQESKESEIMGEDPSGKNNSANYSDANKPETTGNKISNDARILTKEQNTKIGDPNECLEDNILKDQDKTEDALKALEDEIFESSNYTTPIIKGSEPTNGAGLRDQQAAALTPNLASGNILNLEEGKFKGNKADVKSFPSTSQSTPNGAQSQGAVSHEKMALTVSEKKQASPPAETKKPQKMKGKIKCSKNYRQIVAEKTKKAMKGAASVATDAVKDKLPESVKTVVDQGTNGNAMGISILGTASASSGMDNTVLPEAKDMGKGERDEETKPKKKEKRKCQIKTSKTYKQILEEKSKKMAKFAAKKAQEAALEYASEYIPQPAAKLLNDTLKDKGFAAPDKEVKKKKKRKRNKVDVATESRDMQTKEVRNTVTTVINTNTHVNSRTVITADGTKESNIGDFQPNARILKPKEDLHLPGTMPSEEAPQTIKEDTVKTSKSSLVRDTKLTSTKQQIQAEDHIKIPSNKEAGEDANMHQISDKQNDLKKDDIGNSSQLPGTSKTAPSNITTWNITTAEAKDRTSPSNDSNGFTSSGSEYTDSSDEEDVKPQPKVSFKMPGMGTGGDSKGSKVTAIVSNVSKCTSIGGIAKTVAPTMVNGVLGNAKIKKAWQSTGGKCKCCQKCSGHCELCVKLLMTLVSITVVVYDVAMAWVAFAGFYRFEGSSPLTIVFGVVCSISSILMCLELRNAIMSCLTNTIKIKRLQKLGEDNKAKRQLIREERWIEIVSLLELLLGDFPIMIILAFTISYASCGLYNATFKKGIVGKLSLYAVCISALWKGLLSFFQFCLSRPFKKGEEGAPSYLWTIFKFIKPLVALALLFFALYILLTINGVYMNLTGNNEARTECNEE